VVEARGALVGAGRAEALAFYAAASRLDLHDRPFLPRARVRTLLCCYAVGLQATVVGVMQRLSGVRATAASGWWAPWF